MAGGRDGFCRRLIQIRAGILPGAVNVSGLPVVGCAGRF
jgi:hypothetical protein